MAEIQRERDFSIALAKVAKKPIYYDFRFEGVTG